ncbi:hypothetical protein C5167_003469 [Papaver somniferum]|uniref:NAC domain-containing protein n=1 Tax=Papaver somniferum TaxID=3469 RepID=A0A4Y7L3M4_PAPSO|nr:uncharacterized protein LOC113309752 [Papaver somniferum]RZC79242.1 hypothetical protein C5167_003469 [Papaver somniferum]
MELCRSQQLISSQQLQPSSPLIRVCVGGGGGGDKDVFSEPPPPIGFRFIPEEHHLIDYLKKKFHNRNEHFPLILEKNIYDDDDCHPRKLLESHGTEGVVYLFSPRFRKYPNGTRPRRTTKHGKWKNSTKELPVMDHKGVRIGKKSGLVFLPGPEDKAKNWCLCEYWIPEFQIPKKKKAERKAEPIPNMMDEFAIYKLFLSNDPQRQGKKTGRKRVKELSGSTVKLPAKKLAQRVQEPSSSTVKLPAKKLAHGGSGGLQKVEAVCNIQNRQLQHGMAGLQNAEAVYNIQNRQLQHGMAQVGNGQAHYTHNELSYIRNHNEVNNNDKEDADEQFFQNCVFIMDSDHYSDHNFDTFPYPAITHLNRGSHINNKSTHSFYKDSANDNIISNYNGLQGGGGSGGGLGRTESGWENNNIISNYNGLQGGGGSGGGFGRTESGWANSSIVGNYNGLQGGDSGGGFGRSEYGYELPPFPDELVPNYNLYSNSVSQVYGGIASVQSHAPWQQEYPQELPPY